MRSVVPFGIELVLRATRPAEPAAERPSAGPSIRAELYMAKASSSSAIRESSFRCTGESDWSNCAVAFASELDLFLLQ